MAGRHPCPCAGRRGPQRENPEIKRSPRALTFSLHHLILVGRDEPGQTAGQQHADQLLPEEKRRPQSQVTTLHTSLTPQM